MENYESYEHILEYLPHNNTSYINIKNEILYKNIHDFILEYDLSKVIISLSGGVDSMVLLDVIQQIKINDLHYLDIISCHVNYNNRDESTIEKNFLIDYCKYRNIDFHFIDLSFKRGELKRDVYETESRTQRYDFYRKLNLEHKINGVLLAHHEDDLIENIFNNIMRGNREITNITVLKPLNNILNVNIYRPMLNLRKNIIYEYAHSYQIPYFLDTTPTWSCRGKMRNNIFPSCKDCYTDRFKDNLLNFGKESDQLNTIINDYILKDLLDSVTFFNGNIQLKKQKIIQEKYILKNLLVKIAHKYKLCFKFKILDSIILNYHKNIKLSMSKDYIVQINDESILFLKQ